MNYSSFSWTVVATLLAFNLMSSDAVPGQNSNGGYNTHQHNRHGGHRRQRSTKVIGSGMRVHHESLDGASISSSSTSSVTTTSADPSGRLESYEVHLPAGGFYQYHPMALEGSDALAGGLTATATSTATASISGLGLTSFGAHAPPAVAVVRPEGDLPEPLERFGFDVPTLHRSDDLPNCGCVSSCTGEVAAYTLQVLKYTDVVCGLELKTCCFDGPYPGVHDAFASVASCVPQELCLRPYGVLPTDVRDFGAIAPCAGHGAVRCIAVDSVGLLEFRAALSAIQAASYSSHQHEYRVNPVHLVVPLLENGGRTSVQSETTSTVSKLISSGAEGESEVRIERPQQFFIQTPSAPQAPLQQQSPNVFVIHVPAQPQPAPIPADLPACKFCAVREPTTEVIATETVVPSKVTTTTVTTTSEGPAPLVPVAAPPLYPAYRGYSPYAGGFYGYPGFGYGGAGLGFRKHIHLSKGFGFGFGGGFGK